MAAGAGTRPKEKLIIASDALDVDQILGLHAYLAGHFKVDEAEDFRTQPTTWIGKSGHPAAAFGSVPDGARCSPMIFEDAIPAAAADSILSA